MFIQTEKTPNPETIKFLPGQVLIETGSVDIDDPIMARAKSPLAHRVFSLGSIARVFISRDFVSVTKQADQDWGFLKPMVLAAIMDHFTAGDCVLNDVDDAKDTPAQTGEDGPDSEIIIQIKEILEHQVRPAVAQDGGDIRFDRFEDGIVYLEMRGACAGCPSSTATLKMGIENLLKHYIPEVTEVRPAQPDL